jgi:hypothetical protein
MSSELVFSAARSITNRYLLCRLTSKTVRSLHFASYNTHDAIVDAFTRIGAATAPYSELPDTDRAQNLTGP